jgi:maleate isomerase
VSAAAFATRRHYPDARSYRMKFGLIVPATNTSMEHELWGIVFRNQGAGGLRGVGLHTSPVLTPRPNFATTTDLDEYRRQFLVGLRAAVDAAALAEPQAMIMGMSLEHILAGLDAVRAPVAEIATHSGLPWATWHDAAHAALGRFRVRRIGLLTPFDETGNGSATRMFEELGYEVVASAGFACANARDIAHVPDWAKEQAIRERLATPANRLDAIVQCGTNMSLSELAERLEPVIGIPILGINATVFWHALRENGIGGPQHGAGRLLREC